MCKFLESSETSHAVTSEYRCTTRNIHKSISKLKKLRLNENRTHA